MVRISCIIGWQVKLKEICAEIYSIGKLSRYTFSFEDVSYCYNYNLCVPDCFDDSLSNYLY